jgi:hypothetical protein
VHPHLVPLPSNQVRAKTIALILPKNRLIGGFGGLVLKKNQVISEGSFGPTPIKPGKYL